MTHDELFDLRKMLWAEVMRLRQLGDFDANAPAIRLALESSLAIAQHLLDLYDNHTQ